VNVRDKVRAAKEARESVIELFNRMMAEFKYEYSAEI
jgi:hypothetical protein